MEKLIRLITVCTLGIMFLVAGAGIAAAAPAVPASIESTVTVIGVNKKTFVVPTGTSRASLLATLRSHYGTHTPRLDKKVLVIGGKKINLTKAERNSLAPKKINHEHKADAILLASKKPKQTVNANEAVLRGVSDRAVDTIVNKYYEQTKVSAGKAKYSYNSKKKRIDVKSPRKGSAAKKADIRKSIEKGMVDFAAQGYRGTVTTQNVKKQKINPSGKKLGKLILVVRSQRKLYLYNNGKLVKTYRVAVGMPGYSTPSGNFKIGLKRKNPTWGNPGSSWGRGMSGSIGPGPSNPLGVRAMNLDRANGSKTMIRIHGTSNTASIGTAASHGCVRMTNTDVVSLFNQVPTGTPVWIR